VGMDVDTDISCEPAASHEFPLVDIGLEQEQPVTGEDLFTVKEANVAVISPPSPLEVQMDFLVRQKFSPMVPAAVEAVRCPVPPKQDPQAPCSDDAASEDTLLFESQNSQSTTSTMFHHILCNRVASDSDDQPGTPDGIRHSPATAEFSTPVLRRVEEPASMPSSSRFPCYPPLSVSKTVHIIRHGESEYNAALNNYKGWDDPLIFDPHLTDRGYAQARSLKRQLASMPDLEDAVWVVSPLTRAIETFLYSCPFAYRLCENDDSKKRSGKPPKVVMLPELHEHTMTPGDIGRPRSVLMEEFPLLAGPLSEIPEIWWYRNEKHPNCALAGEFRGTETKNQFKGRVEIVKNWMADRSEKLFVAFGHSMFWKEFMGSHRSSHLKNCEVSTTWI